MICYWVPLCLGVPIEKVENGHLEEDEGGINELERKIQTTDFERNVITDDLEMGNKTSHLVKDVDNDGFKLQVRTSDPKLKSVNFEL